MKNVLFVIVASALVSLGPFLALFDKECFPTHGLVCYSVFFILLLFTNIKAKLSSLGCRKILFAITYGLLVFISWIDLFDILELLQKAPGFYALIPFVTPAIALVILKNSDAISIAKINLILFSVFFCHLLSFYTFLNQPILEFTLLKQLEFTSQDSLINRYDLPEYILKEYFVDDSTNISRNFIDTTKNNVIVLVESWGIPLDSILFFSQLNILKKCGPQKIGMHKRKFSHTKRAEKEDLIWLLLKDSVNKKIDTIFIPEILAKYGYSYNKLDQELSIPDSVAVYRISGILNTDSCKQNKCLIVYTTSDTKFPIQGNVNELRRIYDEKLQGTLLLIAGLVREYPETRFIIQGDHEPILSPIEFQKEFYKRWVPFVIF